MAEQAKKIKIKVISIGAAKEVGSKGAKVTQFKGIDQATNEETVFECWSSTLLEHVTPEAVIEVDVVHSVNDTESGIYTHDKVTQVYVDGQPVKTKSSWGGRGGDSDSPEKRASIEAQNAATNICNLIIAGKVGVGDTLGQKVINYLSAKLDGTAPAISPPKGEMATSSAPPVQNPITTDQSASLKRLKENGSNLSALIKGFGFDVTKVSDLTEAQAQTIIDAETEITF